MYLDPKGQDWLCSCKKAPCNHLDYPPGVLLFSKNCVEKPFAVAGMLALLRAAVQRLQCCGWRWPPKDSRYRLTLSAARQAQPENKSGPWFYQAAQGYRSSLMSPSLEQDIQNWTIPRMISSSLVTTYKRSNALEGAFYPFSGMHHIATSMPAQTLGK